MTAQGTDPPEPVSLRRLFPHASFVGCADIRVYHAAEHSHSCRQGSLFAALPGTHGHGLQFLGDALAHGATALLTETPCPAASIPQCIVADPRAAYASLWAALRDFPAKKLCTIGVTGTNGKTTTTYIARSLLTTAGHPTGLLGTIEYHDGCVSEAARLTTPDAANLANWLSRMVRNGVTHAAFELSSHALDQRRCAAAELDVAIITNITRDHLDYHQTFEAYRKAKGSIRNQLKPNGTLILNADDEHVSQIKHETTASTLTCGFGDDADFKATILSESLQGTRLLVDFAGSPHECRIPLLGRHNVRNSLFAAAAAISCGLSPGEAVDGLAALLPVPGRLQQVLGEDEPSGMSRDLALPKVFVDYAHTPDALQHALTTLRRLGEGRVICVFGAGGNRDRLKRPLMGVAARVADLVVLTSDNPRDEDPREIARQILQGMAADPRVERLVELDRAAAIQLAISLARPCDCVLIAGKGHEQTQIQQGNAVPFNDYAIAQSILNEYSQSLRPSRVAA